MSKERLNANEILDLLNTQWADTKLIKKLGYVGTNKAWEISKKIRDELEKEGYWLPRGLVPMEKVVEYFKININYLKKVAKGSEKNVEKIK